MLCYECVKAGKSREAVGLCHHCSAALCGDHACIVSEPISTIYPLFRKVILPKKARLFFCGTCLSALEQVEQGRTGSLYGADPVSWMV
jgi:hypothetical protein